MKSQSPVETGCYRRAVIRMWQVGEHQRGCLAEERALKGDLVNESSMPRRAGEEEWFALVAMHQTLAERGLCPARQGGRQ